MNNVPPKNVVKFAAVLPKAPVKPPALQAKTPPLATTPVKPKPDDQYENVNLHADDQYEAIPEIGQNPPAPPPNTPVAVSPIPAKPPATFTPQSKPFSFPGMAAKPPALSAKPFSTAAPPVKPLSPCPTPTTSPALSPKPPKASKSSKTSENTSGASSDEEYEPLSNVSVPPPPPAPPAAPKPPPSKFSIKKEDHNVSVADVKNLVVPLHSQADDQYESIENALGAMPPPNDEYECLNNLPSANAAPPQPKPAPPATLPAPKMVNAAASKPQTPPVTPPKASTPLKSAISQPLIVPAAKPLSPAPVKPNSLFYQQPTPINVSPAPACASVMKTAAPMSVKSIAPTQLGFVKPGTPPPAPGDNYRSLPVFSQTQTAKLPTTPIMATIPPATPGKSPLPKA